MAWINVRISLPESLLEQMLTSMLGSTLAISHGNTPRTDYYSDYPSASIAQPASSLGVQCWHASPQSRILLAQ